MVILIPDEVYGVVVMAAFVKQYKLDISLNAGHSVLRRLEKKGMSVSYIGGTSIARGGRRKRLYNITKYGYRTVSEIHEQRSGMRTLLPKLNFQNEQ